MQYAIYLILAPFSVVVGSSYVFEGAKRRDPISASLQGYQAGVMRDHREWRDIALEWL